MAHGNKLAKKQHDVSKLIYFCHGKRQSGLERTINIEGRGFWKRQARDARRLVQNMKGTWYIKVGDPRLESPWGRRPGMRRSL